LLFHPPGGDGRPVRWGEQSEPQPCGLEQRLSEDQQVIKCKDGWLEITATVVDSKMLDW
jgi:hypothetical protein